MSTDTGLTKKLIFDTILFTYSATVVGYFGLIAFKPVDQEVFTQNFGSFVTGFFVLSGLMCAMAYLMHQQRMTTIGEALFASQKRKQELSDLGFWRSFWGIHLVLLGVATFVLSIQATQASLTELLDQDGLAGAFRLWTGLTEPNWNLLPKAIAEAVETIFIAFLATALAIPIAFFAAFFCAKNLMTHPFAVLVYSFLRLILNISRSVEPLIWALIFTVWVGVGPFAGMLALMIHSIVSLAKYYSEIIEAVADGPIEGIRSTGANQVQIVWYAVVPQIVLPYLGMTIYRWDTNVRMATIIGLVGGGGIGNLLVQYQGQAMWPEVGCILLVIAFIVWLMDTASAYVREALK